MTTTTPKYIIEGKIDFYSELYKSLDEPAKISSQDLCLISNTPLTENFVTLDCNHKFNYLSLYNDILNHKTKYNIMENHKLDALEIRCPYCRNIQKNLLPKLDGYPLVHGVNFIDENINEHYVQKNSYYNGYINGDCCYKTTNIDWKLDTVTNKMIPLNKSVISCNNKTVKLLDLNNKYYCTIHKYYAIKEITKENKLKAKEDAKNAKLAEKQAIKDAKLAEKQAIKDAKNAKLVEKQAEKQAIKNAKNAKLAEKQAIKDAKNAKLDEK